MKLPQIILLKNLHKLKYWWIISQNTFEIYVSLVQMLKKNRCLAKYLLVIIILYINNSKLV